MNRITEIILPTMTTQGMPTLRSRATSAPMATTRCGALRCAKGAVPELTGSRHTRPRVRERHQKAERLQHVVRNRLTTIFIESSSNSNLGSLVSWYSE